MFFPKEIVREGRVEVAVPKLSAFVSKPSEYAPSKAPVFYNPVMELSRDFAVLALQVFQRSVGKKISVCEPLTGSGLRGIRFGAEVDGVKKVVIGDINERAFKLARRNVEANSLNGIVTVRNEEANCLLSRFSVPVKRFDAVDIDPFGSPVRYIDSALRALRDDGMLALTATDLAPLCGVHAKACVRKYGGRPLRTEYCHELAVRLLAGCVAVVAARYEAGIRVVFSYQSRHYVRVHAIVSYGSRKADESLGQMGYVLHCYDCSHRELQKSDPSRGLSKECPECGSGLSVGGPLWAGSLFDEAFVGLMREDVERRKLRLGVQIVRLLAVMRAEANAPPLYHDVDHLCDVMNLPVPSTKAVAGVLRRRGFEACFTHFSPRGIRSDASAETVKDAIRGLVG